MSRFTFARGRQGSSGATAPSPLHAPSAFNHGESLSQGAYYSPPEVLSPSDHSSPQFGYASRNSHPSLHQSHSSISSPLAQYVQPQPQYVQQQQPRFQPFEQQLSEAQLRDFINSSRERAGSARSSSTAMPVSAGLFPLIENGVHADQFRFNPNQPFADPAIMSARMASPSPIQDGGYGGAPAGLENYPSQQQLAFGPPPGLAFPQGVVPSPALSNRHGQGLGGMPTTVDLSQMGGSAHGELRLYPYQGRESQVRVPSAVLPVRKLYHRP